MVFPGASVESVMLVIGDPLPGLLTGERAVANTYPAASAWYNGLFP